MPAAPSLHLRNSSCGTEAGRRVQTQHGLTRKNGPCCSSPGPRGQAGVLRGPREVRSCEAGIGHRVRAALGGRSLLLLIPFRGPFWKSMAEAPPDVFLGYLLIAGLTIRGSSGKGRWVCIRSLLRRGFCLVPLWGVMSVSLPSWRIWSFLWETCVGISPRKSLGPLWSRGLSFLTGSVSSRAAKIVSFLEPFFPYVPFSFLT